MKKIFEIDGASIQNLDGFFDAVSTVIIPGAHWGRNLDAFDEILGGGFGTPEGGFVIRWKNSDLSREALGFPETLRQLRRSIERSLPVSTNNIRQKIALAENNEGQTLFDVIVEIIQIHGPHGEDPDDGVDLELS